MTIDVARPTTEGVLAFLAEKSPDLARKISEMVGKNQPGVADVHQATALGNSKKDKNKKLFLSAIDEIKNGTPAEPEVAKGKSDPPVRRLRMIDEDYAHTPFPYDATAFSRLREDQVPRFLSAITEPHNLDKQKIKLKKLVAMQDRVDVPKVKLIREAGADGTSHGGKRPVIVRFDGKNHIGDGHHRLTAHWLDGDKKADVHYVDITGYDESVSATDVDPKDDKTLIDKAWSLPIEIMKTDPDQRLVFGWASISEIDGALVIDKQGDVIVPEDLEKAAYDFVLTSRDMGHMHEELGVGRLIESMVFSKQKQEILGIDLGKQGWWAGWFVDSDEVWAKIKKGELPEFSIGGRGSRHPI